MKHLVDFQDEWDFARNYLDTQQLRFGDRLRIDLRMSGSPQGHCIPPLTLQPVLENAIEHGLMSRPGGGRLLVRVRFHLGPDGGPRWWMVVRDSGVAPDQKTYAGETLGNIRLRLERLLRGGGFWVRPASGGGTVAVFTGGPPLEAGPDLIRDCLS
ncbi:MAG: hypothetical protein NXI24_05355 [bacterium]|nr:hypothetical protein [bacterium]